MKDKIQNSRDHGISQKQKSCTEGEEKQLVARTPEIPATNSLVYHSPDFSPWLETLKGGAASLAHVIEIV